MTLNKTNCSPGAPQIFFKRSPLGGRGRKMFILPATNSVSGAAPPRLDQAPDHQPGWCLHAANPPCRCTVHALLPQPGPPSHPTKFPGGNHLATSGSARAPWWGFERCLGQAGQIALLVGARQTQGRLRSTHTCLPPSWGGGDGSFLLPTTNSG